MKIRFVVQDENLLGYIFPEQPDTVQILATSVIKGSIYTWMDGGAVSHPDRQRPATIRDFVAFRVSHEGYCQNQQYEPIPA